MKDLNSIVSDNANTQSAYDRGRRRARAIVDRGLIEDARNALQAARASLNDVLIHGTGAVQRRNIIRIDLPAIEKALRAISRLDDPALPSVEVDSPAIPSEGA